MFICACGFISCHLVLTLTCHTMVLSCTEWCNCSYMLNDNVKVNTVSTIMVQLLVTAIVQLLVTTIVVLRLFVTSVTLLVCQSTQCGTVSASHYNNGGPIVNLTTKVMQLFGTPVLYVEINTVGHCNGASVSLYYTTIWRASCGCQLGVHMLVIKGLARFRDPDTYALYVYEVVISQNGKPIM